MIEIRKLVVTMAVAALVLAACGDDGDAASSSGTDADPATTAEEEGEVAPEETTTTGGVVVSDDGAACLIGRWEAPRDAVEEQVTATLSGIPGVEPELEDGMVTAEFRDDGTADFVTQATVSGNDPTLGRLTGSIDATMGVDWTVAGDQLTYTTTSWDMTLVIADQPIPDVPGPVAGDSASATFSCDGDQLMIEPANALVRLPAEWTRIS